MSDYNERTCTNCGSYLHHEDDCSKEKITKPYPSMQEVKGEKLYRWVKGKERKPKDLSVEYFCRWIDNKVKFVSSIRMHTNNEPYFTAIIPQHIDKIEWLEEITPYTAADEQPAVTLSEDAAEKEVIMQAFDKVQQMFEGYSWLMEGRGMYPYNDDRYREEVRNIYDQFDEIKKDTWANIKSKSGEYKAKVIAEYALQFQRSGGEQKTFTEAEMRACWNASRNYQVYIRHGAGSDNRPKNLEEYISSLK